MLRVKLHLTWERSDDGRRSPPSLQPLPSRSPWGMNARDPGLVLHCTGKFIGIGYSMEHSF